MGRSNIWFTGLPSLSLVISICPTRYTWRLAGFMLQQTFPDPLPLLDVSWEWDDVFFLEWRDDALKALRLDGYKIDEPFYNRCSILACATIFCEYILLIIHSGGST
jgi:hypothetical protein